jgi:hypothetical protein
MQGTLNTLDHRPAHQPGSWVRCDGVGQSVTIGFPYSPAMTAELKAWPRSGRQRSTTDGGHRFPFAALPRVVAFADKYGITVPPSVRALVPAARRDVAPLVAAVASANVYLDSGGRLCVAADRDEALEAALREMNNGQPTWHEDRHVHVVPTHSPHVLDEIVAQFELEVSKPARQVIDAERARQDINRRMAIQATLDLPMPPIPGLARDMTIEASQWPAIWWAVTHKRVIIGDGMGFGKTASALSAVALKGAYPCVVVCRPGLVDTWEEEVEKFFPWLTVFVAEGETPTPIPGGSDIVIIGSAVLGQTLAGGQDFPWVERLKGLNPQALIIDEGQDAKECTTKRSQAMEALAAPIIERDGMVLNLTGTLLRNRPIELGQQLCIMGLIDLFGGWQTFLSRYCRNSKAGERGARYDGATRHALNGELYDRLISWGIMIRRTDPAILGLPEFRPHTIRLAAGDLDPAVMADYRRAERDVIGYLADERLRLATEMGVDLERDPDNATVREAMAREQASHLVKLNTLRTLAGRAKRRYATRWIRAQVAAGEKVLVAADRREEVSYYAKTFGGLKIQGKQGREARREAKRRFNTDPDAKVISVSIAAGGVGHTLHADGACATGIQVELAYSPTDDDQMGKRIHRIGQTRDVNYYRLVAEATIDEYLDAMVAAKRKTLNAVHDGIVESDGEAEELKASVVADVAWALARDGFGGRA